MAKRKSPAPKLSIRDLVADLEVEGEDWDGLSQQDRLFARLYVACGFSAGEAARRMGWGAPALAGPSKLAANPKLKAYAFEVAKLAAASLKIDILSHLVSLGTTTISDVLDYGMEEVSEEVVETETGREVIVQRITPRITLKDQKEIRKLGHDRAIKSIKVDKDGTLTIQMHDPYPALNQLAKIYQLAPEGQRPSLPDGSEGAFGSVPTRGAAESLQITGVVVRYERPPSGDQEA